jgi:Family of unknown function (DUF5995)
MTLDPPFVWPQSMVEIAEAIRDLSRTRTLEEVVDELAQIQRQYSGAVSPGRRQLARDGVSSFNFMYLTVTDRVGSIGDFEHPAFVERLGVVFAEYYLMAYRASVEHKYVSKAWEPLFERRGKRGIAPLQFAIAGMNAHINNDLAWALIQVWDELELGPEEAGPAYRDFVRINDVLAHVHDEVRQRLQSRFLRWLDRALGEVDDRVAGFSVGVARGKAWRRGADMAERLDVRRETLHESQVGFECHLILEPRLDFV